MDTILTYLQLAANLSALLVIGWIYAAYVRNLRSMVQLKDGQLSAVNSHLEFWKAKAQELEKKSPDRLEAILSDRIRIRGEELDRLTQDRDHHQKEIRETKNEIERLNYQLQKALDVGRAITAYDSESDNEIVIPSSELELIKMGEIGVDSACLMISDPCYVQSEWHEEEYVELPRVYRDKETNLTYEFRKHFTRYDESIAEIGKTANELIKSDRFEEIEQEVPPPSMSLSGALYGTRNKDRFGALLFNNGGMGAGIVFSTVYGDGIYPVYGEKYKGRIVRVYVDLQ